MKKIAILGGAGYVGLVSGTCFADFGNIVTCVDIDERKVAMLQSGKSPIFEPGLEELLVKNLGRGQLSFTTDTKTAIQNSELVFICLPTPSTPEGQCDISYLVRVAGDIGKALDGYKIIVNKSTAPPGTARLLEREIRKYTTQPFSVASNPEFLKEGSAVQDFMRPDRVVVGTEDEFVAKVLRELYAPLTINENPIQVVRRESAELGKYGSNAFLAMKVSFINEVAELCDSCGADVKEVARIMGSDSRIGSKFLHAGPGYGGSCFPKDTLGLIRYCQERGLASQVTEAAYNANERHKLFSARKIEEVLGGVAGKHIGVWGLAFKANTDDMRESPALTILPSLHSRGAVLAGHDPQAMENARKLLGDKVAYHTDKYAVCVHSDALVIMTEWNEYRDPDFSLIKRSLKTPTLIDLRNLYYRRRDELVSMGFTYVGMGT